MNYQDSIKSQLEAPKHCLNKSIGVVFGGISGEHDVSIKSALTVINALNIGANKDLFKVLPIYIDIQGQWWGQDIAEKALKKGSKLELDSLPGSSKEIGLKSFPIEIKNVDIWYPVLHGPNGEDGTIQGLFTLMNKPFVGSGVLSSALGMDKLAMKAAFKEAGLSQVPYKGISTKDIREEKSLEEIIKRIECELEYPYFVKPANLGSSVGISKVKNKIELINGLKKASEYDNRLVVEQGVLARELECGVLGKSKMRASVVGEISFTGEWYDYETKYSEGTSQPIIPAIISESVAEIVRKQSIKACNAIGAEGMARVDFFYDDKEDRLWINEINTLPGFTEQSMYPLLWEATGVPLEKLVANLVSTAQE